MSTTLQQRRAVRMTPLFHGSCTSHKGYGLTCDDYTELRRDHNDRCALCGDTHGWMNVDHDHEIAWWAVRGLLCPRCNAGHMRRIDWGERAIDDRTRDYLINPWYLRRRELCTAHDPRVRVSIAELSPADRTELTRLVGMSVISDHSVRQARPDFKHPGIAACLAARDLRPVMRLIWMADRRLLNTDISALINPLPRWVKPTPALST